MLIQLSHRSGASSSYVPKGDLILSKVAKAVYLDKLEEEEEERFELYEY